MQDVKDFFMGDRNRNEGIPTLSNTNNWNTIQYDDGSEPLTGIQIHPGRDEYGSGISDGCLMCSDVEFGQLNQMFNDNYSNGGVSLAVTTPLDPINAGFNDGVNRDAFDTFEIDTYNGSSSAFGGFLLYPNKLNTNMTRYVYSK
ncbi:MAG: hypothetical protein GY816_02265 [Cytophagales bacterium]|nr:hypothetical protein [Cytophagales bacterium]